MYCISAFSHEFGENICRRLSKFHYFHYFKVVRAYCMFNSKRDSLSGLWKSYGTAVHCRRGRVCLDAMTCANTESNR